MIRKFFVLFFIAGSLFLHAQSVVPISTIKTNNADGIPVGNGQVFTISGIVTSSTQLGSAGPGTVQDATGAIAVYGSSFCSKVKLGDSVTVTSTLTFYNGLAELDFSKTGSAVTVHSSGHSVEPLIVTINEINNQSWNGIEEFESELIRINNVTISETGNFAGNKNYTITDASGSGNQMLRIDTDVSSLVGSPIPPGKVDVIGILGQYKTSAPYNSGYQIQPRFIADIIDDGRPNILNPVFTSNIAMNSFVVNYTTSRNGNTKVKYGFTQALELDSVFVDNDTTIHIVKISGLQPGKTYYYKVYSVNSKGSSESAVYQVTTASGNPEAGAINIYFNYPVDTSVAIPGNAAKGNINFASKLVERINNASYSLDMALYSFIGLPEVVNAIIGAKNRGVKVRVVYDSRTTQNSMQNLIDAGIKISKRPPDSGTFSGIMHNKFIIVDARDTIAANDWVWTGSWNISSTELTWKNNVIEINDQALAAAYTKEFEEMWGSNTDEPDAAKAKFGMYKTDNTPHNFSIGGKEISLYFSPSDKTNSYILSALNSANYSIYMALLVFTRDDLYNSILYRKNAGVQDIRGIIEQYNTTGSEYQRLGLIAEMFTTPSGQSILHHKYAIIDASYPKSDPVLITGSHNWSTAAETDNDENTLIIKDANIANLYMQEFKKRYNDYGGTGTFVVPVSVNDKGFDKFNYTLYQNYPNPFNPVTTIRFEVPSDQKVTLQVYDILGRKIKTLFDGEARRGIVAVDFNASGFASGIYFYTIKTESYTATKKLMLLK
jgi:phosphatidylserine/phosphatidylglycerophosphate/cardiolipin synthase-like enzyme